MVATAFLFNSLATAAFIKIIVQRAKKCLDFSITAYFLHLVATSCFSGFPTQISWWLCMGIDLAITAFLSEWWCLQEELKEIPLASIPRQGATELSSISIAQR